MKEKVINFERLHSDVKLLYLPSSTNIHEKPRKLWLLFMCSQKIIYMMQKELELQTKVGNKSDICWLLLCDEGIEIMLLGARFMPFADDEILRNTFFQLTCSKTKSWRDAWEKSKFQISLRTPTQSRQPSVAPSPKNEIKCFPWEKELTLDFKKRNKPQSRNVFCICCLRRHVLV